MTAAIFEAKVRAALAGFEGRPNTQETRAAAAAVLASVVGGLENPALKIHLYHPDTGRTLLSLPLTAEDAEALGLLGQEGRHLRAMVTRD